MITGIPPQLELPPTIYERIRNGQRGIVFKISKEYAAKILYKGTCFTDTKNFRLLNNSEAIPKLEYEWEIAGLLYDFEISVPKPVGIEKLRFFNDSEITYPALIMEYLPFPSGADLGYHEHEKALKLAKKEIFKSLEYGFTPGEDSINPNNFMYNRGKNKIHLIDFEFWSFEEQYKSNYQI